MLFYLCMTETPIYCHVDITSKLFNWVVYGIIRLLLFIAFISTHSDILSYRVAFSV